ncbi:MAG: Gfo/Idh/MocA family oxidoreductase [Desulfofustis sp.]|nr:Gfo/Idh/MocA family oxidoreductase [Desulfofustis sp.]
MKKLRIGVLSTAKIGLEKVIPAMQHGQLTEVTAISSRSVDKARAAAEALGINKHYGSYEELLADPEIDAVYNPLPNYLHCPWSKKAMQAGKHVLCEKPLGLTGEEIEDLIATRDECGVMAAEAFMVKSCPQWIDARERVRGAEIGDLRAIQAFFSYDNRDPGNIRNIVETGGGAMWDIGCYPVVISRYLFESEPLRAAATIDFDPSMKTDRLASVVLEFNQGQATFSVSTQLVPYQRVHLLGTTGHLELVIPFNAPNDRSCILRYDSGTLLEEEVVSHSFPVMDQYTLQGDDFARAVLEGTEIKSTLEDGLANTRVIKAIFTAAKEQRWVTI